MKTYEQILQDMLDRVPGTLDKRPGSIIYDALAPAAVEMQLMYIELETVLNETFADTASREYLIKRAAERGLAPYPASKAVLKGVFNIDVPIGSRFSGGDLNYVVLEKITDLEFRMECETAGAAGNNGVGALIPIEYVEGLTSAELTEVLIPGEDEEDTEVFRQRYFDSLESQAYGGNIADYRTKTNQLQGVGGVKVYPTWAGGGTVKLVIIDSDYEAPSPALIDSVQTQIDPVTNQGEGVGIAPIGHVVTVAGVTDQILNIATNLTYQAGWSWADVEASVQDKVDQYFLELKQGWESAENVIVRISQIEIRLLDLEGIVDIADTTLNGVAQNFVVDPDKIPARGVITDAV